jgi:hypothetical protein
MTTQYPALGQLADFGSRLADHRIPLRRGTAWRNRVYVRIVQRSRDSQPALLLD